MTDIILMCNICKSVLKSELQSKYFYLKLSNDNMAKHLKECNSQFLDIDNEVKSCFQAYIEQLIKKYKYVLTPHYRPERSKREEFDKCNKCFCLRIVRMNNITRDEAGQILDLSDMRCSEHCSNAVREAQETSSPKEI